MDIQNFYQQLPGLDAKLRAEGMKSGPDVWLLVVRLLERLQQQDRLPNEPKALIPLLGPLFCRYPEDQARFPVIFEEWLNGGPSLASVVSVASPEQKQIAGARVKVRRAAWLWAGAALVLAGLLAALIISQPVKNPTAPATQPTEQTQPVPDEPSTSPPKDLPATPLENRVPPRLLPEPLPKAWVVAGEGVDHGLDVLPWMLALMWLAWRYHRQWILRTQAPSGGELLDHLRFKRLLAPIFGGYEAERAMRELRAARLEPTRRLDIAATVEATARRGDYFQPVYRSRRVAPEHLLLVQSAHRNDQQAALAEELAERFRSLGLTVRAYRFRDDPRFLMRWLENDGEYVELAQLAARHGAARLLVIGEAQLLFHPYSGEVRPWLDELAPWQDRVWLHPRDAGPEHAELLSRHEFLLLPLSRESLPSLVAHITGKQLPKGEGGAGDVQTLDLPDLIAAEPDSWLGEKPPYGADLPGLVRQLEQFLGTYGLRLLRAVAVYPRPNWDLTLALDYLLYGKLGAADPPQRSEQRLARLSRLPWLTHAHLPDWLRECLLRGMNDEERQRIVTVWRQLFGQLTDSDSLDTLRLDIKTPNKRQVRLRLADLRTLRHPAQVDDPIFVNILLGGRLGLLDFELPRAVARLLPGGRWLISLKPLLLALVLAGLSVWGGNTLWDVYGRDGLAVVSAQLDKFQNRRWTVNVAATGDTESLALAIKNALQAIGFSAIETAKPADKQIGPIKLVDQPADNANRLYYPPGGEPAAQRVADLLAHMTFGTKVELQPKADLSSHVLLLQLAQTHLPGAKFHDAMAYPWHPGVNAGNVNATSSTLPPGFPIPPMVKIPAGSFVMGCADKSTMCEKDEFPARTVKLNAFFMGRNEVSFNEYDAYVDSLATGKTQPATSCASVKVEKPDDNQWGRGQRPVINVSFDQARCYAAWLAGQTGLAFRLPTEAEWEYAARAGTQTSWFWGEDGNQAGNYAWYSGNSGNSTHPIGEKQPNPFGLYDTAGNVWEWTADCWHGDYNNAPVDGSAWLEANQGECVRRVVRGGSWNFIPLLLRSGFRYRGNPANIYLGFRLARDY
ncbi:MAG: SUMF1/EgtB/PvdO family nonheme iron enzyme [Candidatus Methylumidiphilus sp.]